MSGRIRTPAAMARRVIRASILTFAAVACQPAGPCGLSENTSFPDIGVNRILAVDSSSGATLRAATVRREYPDGSLSQIVPIDRIAQVDQTKLKGRSAMTVLVGAAGFADARLSLPETCEVAVTPIRVLLNRLP
jgi:hypothetical protein